jgi:hypothetical protein
MLIKRSRQGCRPLEGIETYDGINTSLQEQKSPRLPPPGRD